MAPFTTGLAEHLSSEGNQVSVVTSLPHYPGQRIFAGYRGRWLFRERINGVDLIRWRIPMLDRVQTLQRLVYDFSLAPYALMTGLVQPRPDLVITVSPPVQLSWALGLIARARSVPHIMFIQDLPVDLAQSVGMLRPGKLVSLAQSLERLAYRSACALVVITPGFKAKLIARGVPPEKVHMIPNWANLGDILPGQPEQIRSLLGAGPDDFLLVYLGNMGRKQALHAAIDAVGMDHSDAPFRLALIGDGAERQALVEYARRAGVSTVSFLASQPPERMASVMAAADALLLPQRADVVDSVAPSKLLAYMAAGRPTIAAVTEGSEAGKLVGRTGAGIIVRPESPSRLLEAVNLLRQNPNLRLELGRAGHAAAELEFSRLAILKAWTALVSAITDIR